MAQKSLNLILLLKDLPLKILSKAAKTTSSSLPPFHPDICLNKACRKGRREKMQVLGEKYAENRARDENYVCLGRKLCGPAYYPVFHSTFFSGPLRKLRARENLPTFAPPLLPGLLIPLLSLP